MIESVKLFKPMLIGWSVCSVLTGFLVGVVYLSGKTEVLAHLRIFGMTFSHETTPGNLPIWFSIFMGLYVMIFGCLQGLVNWLVVSIGLAIAKVFRINKNPIPRLHSIARSENSVNVRAGE